MGRVAMITGAAKNTGWATAKRFASEGYDVIITSRKASEAEAAAEKLMAEHPGCKAWGMKMDLDSVPAIREGFAHVATLVDHLDAFVANAAHLGVGVDIFTATEEDYDAVMAVNAKGTFFCCQEAIKLMHEGSAICLISSIQSVKAVTGRTVYSSSKGAINAMTRSLAIELAYLGIRVNALIAGAIHSERWDVRPPELTAFRRSRYPSGREAMPEEIAAGVYYLCSDQSLTVTGTELTIDSGLGACALPYDKEWRNK